MMTDELSLKIVNEAPDPNEKPFELGEVLGDVPHDVDLGEAPIDEPLESRKGAAQTSPTPTADV